MRKPGAFLGLALFFVPVLAFPAEGVGLVFRASVLAILEDNGMEGDPAPILPSPGFSVSFPIPVSGMLRFEPGVDLYATYYGYSYTLDRAVPYAIENRSSLVIGTLLGLPLQWELPVARGVRVHLLAGPGADLRLCLVADGLEGDDYDDAASQTSDIAGYFWSQGRWALLLAGGGVDFPFTPSTYLGVEFRFWYPAYRLWTGENLPGSENLKFSLGLTLSFC